MTSAFSLHGCFGDHMVLQRGAPIRISGFGEPDTAVTGVFRGRSANCTVGESGEWELSFPACEACGPCELAVRSYAGAQIVLHDVMVGELWFCSGQSNMEFPVLSRETPFWGLPDGEKCAAESGDAGIRLFQSPRGLCPDSPCAEPPGRPCWKLGDSPEAVGEFSAVAWFFGKALRRMFGGGVAVGLVHSSWGGTMIEPWISRAGLEKGGFADELAALDAAAEFRSGATNDAFAALHASRVADLRAWLRDRFFASDPATTADALAHWAAPQLPPGDDKKWKRGPRDCSALTRPATVWYRREFTAPPSWEGKTVAVHMASVNDCDETYLDGGKIGETDVSTHAYWAQPRDYAAVLEPAPGGRHVLAVRVMNHFSSGNFKDEVSISCFGAEPAKIALDGGEWAERTEFVVDPEKAGVRPPVPDGAETPRLSAQTPSTLFNAMVAPFAHLAVHGAIWYQGCSNSQRPQNYARLQDALVAAWREAFRNPDLVFIGTELSAFREQRPGDRLAEDWWRALSPDESALSGGFAPIREAQRRLLDMPGCGLACTIDVGDAFDIHPARKRPVGERLAL
ncbi:MAG: hypothetical protein IJ678_04680, partial [Kiritimatiellae bacterium]|nr:hypothetical protein [Kiritimatiellia bacterium]